VYIILLPSICLLENVVSDVRNVIRRNTFAEILRFSVHCSRAHRRFRVHAILIAPTTRIYRDRISSSPPRTGFARRMYRFSITLRPSKEFFSFSLFFILIHKNSRTVSRYLTSRKNKLRVSQVQQYYISRYGIR